MSGGVRTFKLQGGGYADVPEDKIDEWMRRMDQRGVQFETADVSADMQVGEPEVIKTPSLDAGVGGVRKQPEQPSMADRFLSAGGDALQTGADTLRGALRGATMGYGDKLEAGARSLLSGRSYADEFADQNAMVDAAAARSPYAFNTAKTLAGAPYDLAAAVAGAPGGLGGEVATSGILGSLRGGGFSRSPTLEGTLEDANLGGAEGAGWGLGGGLVGRFLASGSDALTSLAPKARGAAMGELGTAAKAARKAKGDEFVEGLPQAADELGMTPQVPFDWRHPVDSMRQKLTFKSPGDYADQAQSLMDDVHGPAKGEAVRQATAQGVTVPRADLVAGLQAKVQGRPINDDLAPYADSMARRIGEIPPGTPVPGAQAQLTASQVDKRKMDWAAGGYAPRRATMTEPSSFARKASRDASNVAGSQLGDAMDTMALPDTADAYHVANDAYEKAASIENMGRAKQRDLDSQSPFSLPNVGRILGGVAGGATLGGQVAGIPGAIVGGVAGFAGNKAMQNYGPDIMADFLRSGSSMHPSTPRGQFNAVTGAFEPLPFGSPGGGMRDAAVGGTLGGAIAGPAGAAVGGTLGAMGRPGMQAATGAGQAITGSRDRYEDPGATAQREIENGRGYMLSDAAIDALQNDRQALGRFAPQFAQAWSSNEPDAVSVLIKRLSHEEPDFRTQVLPALRARTGEF